MTRVTAIFSILGLAVAALAEPQTGQFAPNLVPKVDPAGQATFSSEVAAATASLKEKFAAGNITPADLAENLEAINDLIVKHLKDGDREQLGRLYLLAAHIDADGLKETARAKAIWTQVARSFPGTQAAQGAKLSLARLDAELAAKPSFQVSEVGNPQIGRLAPNFTATDVNGKTVTLSNYLGRIVVMESFFAGCPFCAYHYEKGVMQALQRECATNGVVWLLIDPSPKDAPAVAKKIRTEQKMAITDWIIDEEFRIARIYAMRTAPHMFVIDKNGVLAYQGAIDNQPILDGDPGTARNYVREAVRALLAGKKAPVSQTKPYGCSLLYTGMPDEQMFRPPGNWR